MSSLLRRGDAPFVLKLEGKRMVFCTSSIDGWSDLGLIVLLVDQGRERAVLWGHCAQAAFYVWTIVVWVLSFEATTRAEVDQWVLSALGGCLVLLLVICLLVASTAYLGLQGELGRILWGWACSLLVFVVIDGCYSILMRVNLIVRVHRIGHNAASQEQIVLRRWRFVKLTRTWAKCDAVCYALGCQRCCSDRRWIDCGAWNNGLLTLLLIILPTSHLVPNILWAWAGILQVIRRVCF